MILKNRLKELRARDGLNQSELAKLAGVSRQSIFEFLGIQKGPVIQQVLLNLEISQ